jgi:15-cis-phytoene synthase
MTDLLLNELTPPLRLALAYAPRAVRPAATALFALDQRLERQVRQTSELILGQVRLAWWRERLADLPQLPAGEPLLAACAAAQLRGPALTVLIDGWEAVLLAEDHAAAVAGLADTRGGLFALLADTAGAAAQREQARLAGQRWALADLAVQGGESAIAQLARAELSRLAAPRQWLPRGLRSLAMLDGWALALARHQSEVLQPGWKDLSVMLRIGLFG